MPYVKKREYDILVSNEKHFRERCKEFSPKKTVDEWLEYELQKGLNYRVFPFKFNNGELIDWETFIREVCL